MLTAYSLIFYAHPSSIFGNLKKALIVSVCEMSTDVLFLLDGLGKSSENEIICRYHDLKMVDNTRLLPGEFLIVRGLLCWLWLTVTSRGFVLKSLERNIAGVLLIVSKNITSLHLTSVF